MRHAALAILGLVLLSLAAPRAAGHDEPAGERAFGPAERDFTQRHLTIYVRPNLKTETVGGRVHIRFESLTDALRTLHLHCEDTTVHAVRTEDGTFLRHDLAKGTLRVTLGAPLARGEESTVVIAYTSRPTRGLFFHAPSKENPGRPWMMYSQGQANENRRWIPCYDLPDDRCSWDLYVDVPERLETVSNGVLVEQEALKDGLRRDHWHFSDRAPTYLISLIVGAFETVEESWRDVSVEYKGPPGRAEELRRALGKTPAMLEFFSTYLDAPYPWPRYAQTLVWDFVYGGMENVTATTLNMRVLHSEAARPNYRSDALVAHELAHMWFGDWLTCRTWNHIWLNEGFATYFTDLFFEHDFGPEEFTMRRRRQNEGYMKGTPNPEKLGLEIDPRGDVPLELSGGKAYSRGAAILHMLRLELGDETFRDCMRAYVQRHKDQAVVSEQLRRTMEDVSGRDLGWFWDQWVYRGGYPVFEVRRKGRSTLIAVKQVQARSGTQGLFRMRIPVRSGKEGPVRMLRITKAEHEFDVGGDPEDFLRFGVGGDLLMRVRLVQSFEAWSKGLQDADLTGRLDAVLALEAFGPRAVAPLATALVKDECWAVREAAAKTLGRMGEPGTPEALLAATNDLDARVRAAVAEALGQQTRANAGVAVVALAKNDTSPYVRAAAARSAGKLKVEGALELLRALARVDSHVDVVRTGAVDGMRHLGDPQVLPEVLAFTAYRWGKGQTHALRNAAMDCATALGPDDRTVHATLIVLLDDPFHRTRQRAAKACGVYGVRGAIPKLQKLAADDWNGGVKSAANKALERLNAK